MAKANLFVFNDSLFVPLALFPNEIRYAESAKRSHAAGGIVQMPANSVSVFFVEVETC